MSLFTDTYVAYQVGKKVGNHFGKSCFGTVNTTVEGYKTAEAVSAIRKHIFALKKDVASAEITPELLRAIIEDKPQTPPDEMYICSSFIAVSTGGPTGKIVYENDGCMDYPAAEAFFQIIQDMYPDVYSEPTCSVEEFINDLNEGTWNSILTKKRKYQGKILTPAFSIDDLQQKDISELPISMEDPLQKNNKTFATLSFIILAIAVLFIVLTVVFDIRALFAALFSIAGIVVSFIGMIKASKVCSISLTFNILALVVSLITALAQAIG